MNIVNLVQSSPEWHAHRANHFNASDAPAMLGVSPYRSRADLLRERASGIAEDVSADTQRLFDRGHRAEALARPLAEQIIGDELWPCTGTEGQFSASFDGLTMDGSTAWEHKLLSKRLREAFEAIEEQCGDGALLPEDYRVQCEHQLMVSGAERTLFMASEWDHDGNLVAEFHCWYEPDHKLRERIVAGWEQFEQDLAAYVPEHEPVVQAAPVRVEGFGALSLRVEGRVLASNVDAFRADAEAFLSRLPKPADLQSDQDFAEAEGAVKACSEAESRIKAAKDAALAQMADVDAVLRAADSVAETIRAARLALDKAVKAEKENRKTDLVRRAAIDVREHCGSIKLDGMNIEPPASLLADMGAAIKGLKTLASMRDKLDAAVANAKIEASQRAERIRANLAVLAEFQQHASLFPDRAALAQSKAPEDLRNLVAARIAEHERQQAAKLEAERERIRAEESARLEREQAARARMVEEAAQLPDMSTERVGEVLRGMAARRKAEETSQDSSGKTITLGQIKDAIAPLSITADGLAELGFDPVGHERAAKLYRAADFPRVIAALQRLLISASLGEKAAA